jgi:hypothetical protein
MKIDLGIGKNYIKNWTAIDAIRELTQNCIDEGNYYIQYNENVNNGILELTNHHTTLSIDKLVLGQTTKDDDETKIGKYGEGFKLALLVLTRDGHNPIIYNGDEIWESSIEVSTTFGIETLHINIEQNKFPTFDLSFIIENCSEIINEIIEENLIIRNEILNENIEIIETQYGDLILDDYFKGKIYVGGLFVQNDDSFDYGFNFAPEWVDLDRDRKAINIYALRTLVSKLILETDNAKYIVKELIGDSHLKDDIIEQLENANSQLKSEVSKLYCKEKHIDLSKSILFVDKDINEYLKITDTLKDTDIKIIEEDVVREMLNEQVNKTNDYDKICNDYDKWNEIKNTIPEQLLRFNRSDYKKALALYNAHKDAFDNNERFFYERTILRQFRTYDFPKILSMIDRDMITDDDVLIENIMEVK